VTRSPRSLGVIVASAVAAVLALTLSSCGTPQAGAAAVVGDHRITVTQLQTAYRDIVPLVGQDQQITQGQILNLLILAPYLTSAASAEGRGVSTQDARLDMKAAGATDIAKVSNSAVEVWKANLASSALQTDRTTAQIQAAFQGISVRLKKDGVHVNPRYGAGLDYSNFSIIPEQPDWLVTAKPVAAATPTPAATSAP
jgi:hypothetical protein